MEHRIGTGTHGNVQSHGIHEGLTCGYTAWQNALVAILVICKGILYYLTSSILEELYAIGVCGKDGTITGKRKTNTLGKVVHRIGGKHTTTASTSGTCTVLYLGQLLLTHGLVSTLDHGCYQVEVLTLVLTSLHRTTAHKYGRDIQSHCRHEHTGSYLVTIGNAYHSIGLVGIAHILHAICYDVTARQRI